MLKYTLLILHVAVGLAVGISVEKRDTGGGHSGGGHTGGGHSGGGHTGGGHSGGGHDTGTSSYAVPAAPASIPAPVSQSYEGGTQGNLYYYYYPVEAYGQNDVQDAGFDVFTAIILPLLILGGILLALSSLSFSVGTGRELMEDNDVIAKLHSEIETAFNVYLQAFESDECIQRTVCQAGVYAKRIKGKDLFLRLVQNYIPEEMKGNISIFMKAASSGYKMDRCLKYKCKKPRIGHV